MSVTVVGSIAFDAVKTPFGERERMLGGAAVHFALAASFFDEVRVPAANLIGSSEGRGFSQMMEQLPYERLSIGVSAVASAELAVAITARHANERKAFGKPLMDLQNTRFKLAEKAANIEAARQLMYYVAAEIDSKRRCDKEASMVKFFASEMAERVTSDALQLHGGYGYTRDLPIERYWRDARLTKIFEGTSQIQLRIISDRLLGGGE